MKKAIFGAGCFWGVEETFRCVPGVIKTTVGYAGGTLVDPTYEDVCSGQSGHTEVVEVEYDPIEVTYEKLLEIFFVSHDPTTLNRQGPDVGYQYRSVIFYTCAEQQELALASKNELDKSGRLHAAIATAIEPVGKFYRAEEYHQGYLQEKRH